MFFSGDSSSKRRVNLRGSSRGEESREQVLERTRLERETRRQQKLEKESATRIQAFWRGHYCRKCTRQQVKRVWQQTFGDNGEHADRDAVSLVSPFLRQVCFVVDTKDTSDVQCLAQACRIVLNSYDASGRLLFCSQAGENHQIAARVAYRAFRLASLSLEAITLHRVALQHQLTSPRQSDAYKSPLALPPLLEYLIAITDANTWAGTPAAATVAEQIVQQLAVGALFPSLAQLVSTGCPLLQSSTTEGKLVPSAEALATTLASRALKQTQEGTGVAQLVSSALRQIPLLLCVPLLWARCPTLRPLGAPLVRRTIVALQQFAGRESLLSWLPDNVEFGRAGAAAALLGNMVEVGSAAMKMERASTVPPMATHFAEVVCKLLLVAPIGTLFPTSQARPVTDDEDEAGPSQPQVPSTELVWRDTRPPPSQLVAQVQQIANAAFLTPLVQLMLPVATAESPPGDARTGAGASAMALCRLLYEIVRIPARELRQKALISLGISANFIPRLWFTYLKGAYAGGGGEAWAQSGDDSCDPGWMLPLALLAQVFSTYLTTADLAELHRRQRPLALQELYSPEGQPGLLGLLKFSIWQVIWVEPTPQPGGWGAAAAGLRSELRASVGKLLGQLYDHNCRQRFAPPEAFHVQELPPERFHSEVAAAADRLGSALPSPANSRVWTLLQHAPFLVSFHERARVFQTLVSADRSRNRDMELMQALANGPNSFVPIHRSRLLEDGFEQLSGLREGLKARVRIQFFDEYGVEEAGVDGGGLFKDFMEALVLEGFNPEVGLFNATADNRLYPNPAAHTILPQAYAYYEFLGRMLGKALYEGILVELPLAGFFLKKFRTQHCDVADLPSLDADLYRSLMFLRDYAGDVADLGLFFTAASPVPGAGEVELVPGGRDRPVTQDNRIEYIHRIAELRLNVQLRRASEAFIRGFQDLVQREWVAMFNEQELQMLISGGVREGFDVEDLRRHCNYAGGYHEEHPVIIGFWKAVESLMPEQQGLLLKFVTACSRAPLLGFKYLEPGFCVQMAGSVLDPGAVQRLPTSATCMNLLKLPPYRSAEEIREKLLYAMGNASGFDLS